MDSTQTLIQIGSNIVANVGTIFGIGYIFARILKDDMKKDRESFEKRFDKHDAEHREFNRTYAKQVEAREKRWEYLIKEIHKIKLDQVRKR